MRKRIEPEDWAVDERIKDFREVCRGFTSEQAIEEASRCLDCKVPLCVSGCPVEVDIPKFIKNIKDSEFEKAFETISITNNLAAVCGRVCPQEKQCEFKCILQKQGQPINIGKLERFAAQYQKNVKKSNLKKKEKIVVIGSGPAGLSCASDLAKHGYKVTILEAMHAPGGVLIYGVPEFRLPNPVVLEEISKIEKRGVKIEYNVAVGRTVTIAELLDTYDAIFIGSGAGLPVFLNIAGEDLNNVYAANEFLTRVNLMGAHLPERPTPVYIGKRLVVVGGGNVAMDAARTAKRLKCDVTVVYRRTETEMPAREEEVRHAKEEGINFMILTNPVRILGQDKVEGIRCIQMMLGDADVSGRRKPVPIEGSEFDLPCDEVIIAIGQGSNPLITRSSNLKHNINGGLIVDDKMMTSLEGVFAGGDIIGGNATVIRAMGDGKRAAKAIDEFLTRKKYV